MTTSLWNLTFWVVGTAAFAIAASHLWAHYEGRKLDQLFGKDGERRP